MLCFALLCLAGQQMQAPAMGGGWGRTLSSVFLLFRSYFSPTEGKIELSAGFQTNHAFLCASPENKYIVSALLALTAFTSHLKQKRFAWTKKRRARPRVKEWFDLKKN
jgi:hypothetical protein